MPTATRESERAFQATLVETLRLFGYEEQHVYPLQTKHGWRSGCTATGWPDLVCVRPPRILAIEVKGLGRGVKFPDEQRAWLTLFATVPGCRSWLVNPADPEWHTLLAWIRRPGPAPRTYGFQPMDVEAARRCLARLR